jgi:hypothetical protein
MLKMGCYVLNTFVAAWVTATDLDDVVVSVTLHVLISSCFSGTQNKIQVIWAQNWVLPSCFSFLRPEITGDKTENFCNSTPGPLQPKFTTTFCSIDLQEQCNFSNTESEFNSSMKCSLERPIPMLTKNFFLEWRCNQE